MPSNIRLPYETDYPALLNWHNSTDASVPTMIQPYKKYLYNPVAAGVSKLGGFVGNVGSAMFQPDQRTASEKGTAMANYVEDRVGSGIGSSHGSRTLGVPTPGGMAPMWSMNFGEGTGSKSQPVPAALNKPPVKSSPPAPVRPPAPSPKPVASTKRGPTTGGTTPTPSVPVPEAPLPKFVGYGGYSDGSPITDTLSTADKALLPGNNAGVFQQSGTTPALGPNNQIGLWYTPEEQAQVAQMGKERDARLALGEVGTAGRDMSPGSQGDWERQQLMEQQFPLNPALRDIPKFANARAKLIQEQQQLDQGYELGKGTLNVNRFNADTQRTTGLGTLGVHQGDLALRAAKQPFDIEKIKSDIGLQGVTGDKLRMEISQMPDETLAKMIAALGLGRGGAGENAQGADLDKGMGTLLDIDARLQEARLAKDQDRINLLTGYRKTVENNLKNNPAKGTVPKRPALNTIPRGQ